MGNGNIYFTKAKDRSINPFDTDNVLFMQQNQATVATQEQKNYVVPQKHIFWTDPPVRLDFQPFICHNT